MEVVPAYALTGTTIEVEVTDSGVTLTWRYLDVALP